MCAKDRCRRVNFGDRVEDFVHSIGDVDVCLCQAIPSHTSFDRNRTSIITSRWQGLAVQKCPRYFPWFEENLHVHSIRHTMLRTVLNSVRKNTTRMVVVPSASRSMASSADELTLEVRLTKHLC